MTEEQGEIEREAGRGRPKVTAMLRGAHWELVRRCALAVAFIFVAYLLVQGQIAALYPRQSWGLSGEISYRTVEVIALALTPIAFLFGAGLLRVLLGAERRDDVGGGGVLAAARRTVRLLVTLLAGAAFLTLVAFDSIGFSVTAPIAIALGTVPFTFALYVVPLIVHRRLSVIDAVRQSTHLVRAAGFVRQWLFFVGMVVGTAAFGFVAVRALVIAGANWRPSVGDTSTWLVSGQDNSAEIWHASITYETVMVGVVGAVCAVLLCFLVALALAAAYSRRERDDAFAPAPAEAMPAEAKDASAAAAPRRHIGRRLVAPFVILLLLAGANAYVWSFASPLHGHTLAPGEKVTMRNGLTLTAPATGQWMYVTPRFYPSWLGGRYAGLERAVDVFFSEGSISEVRSFSVGTDPTTILDDTFYASSPVAAASADGSVRILWKSGNPLVAVETDLPGHSPGLIVVWVRVGKQTVQGPAQMMASLEKYWRTIGVQGATLPAPAAWRSQSVAPGRRVKLASGLSMVMPHGWPAAVARSSFSGFPAESFMPALLNTNGLWSGVVYSRRSTDPALKSTGAIEDQLIARSTDGSVEVRGLFGKGNEISTFVRIITHLPGRQVGVLYGTFKEAAPTKAAALRLAQRIWTLYRVEGAALPKL